MRLPEIRQAPSRLASLRTRLGDQPRCCASASGVVNSGRVIRKVLPGSGLSKDHTSTWLHSVRSESRRLTGSRELVFTGSRFNARVFVYSEHRVFFVLIQLRLEWQINTESWDRS
jgi:hypothetical protein